MNTDGCTIDFDALSAAGFNMNAAEERFAGMGQLYEKCLLLYFRSDNITALEQMAAESDWENVQKCAHTLKGSAGNLALEPLYDIYTRICTCAKKGETSGIPAMLAQARSFEDAFRQAAGSAELPEK